MAWTWTFESDLGEDLGRSDAFDSRGDAESWVGEVFSDLVERGIDRVRLYDGTDEVYGPMSLHAGTS